VINVIEIVSRTVFDVSYAWIFETNLLLAAWTYFLGIVPVYARNGDIAIIGLRQIVPVRMRADFDRLLDVISAATFGLVAWYAWTLIELQWPFRTPGSGLPNVAFTFPVLLGCVAMVLGLARRIVVGHTRRTSSEAQL
jgi:TRAP-type C4-dicarboxylate transport system permease small subunit